MTSWNALACGVLGCALAAGCGKPPAAATKADAKTDDDHEHGAGPHGGTVVDIAGVHAEFCVDHGKKEATVYILDGKRAKTAEPIAAGKVVLSITSPKFQVDLPAAPQPGDPPGKASRFAGRHDSFGVEQEFAGTITLELDGKQYNEDFKEEAHDHDKTK